MHIITLGNLYSTIDDVKGAVLRELKKDLSVMSPGYEHVPSYKKGFWNGRVNFYTYNKDTKVFTFPTGLLSIAAKVIKECDEEFHIADSRTEMNVSVPDEIKLKHSELGSITLRDYQYDSVAQGLKSTRGVINVATNGGKCVTKDTLILTEDGYKSVEKIFLDNGTPCEDGDKAIPAQIGLVNRYGEIEHTSHLTFNGKKKVTRVQLSTGIEMKNTSNHPILTVHSDTGELQWVNTENLSIGDLVVTRVGDEVYGNNPTVSSEEEAYLIGALIADGYLGDYSKVSFTNNQRILLDKMSAYFRSLNPKRVYEEPNSRSKGSVSLCMSGVEPIKLWKERLGLSSETSSGKEVPTSILEAPKNIQVAFLSGYLECECDIDVSRPRMEVTSASKKLLSQVQLMLKNMGILSTLSTKKAKNNPNNYYGRLIVSAISNEKFFSLVSFCTPQRIEQHGKAISKINSTKARPSKDLLPNGKDLMTQYKDTYINAPSGMKKKMFVPSTISRTKARNLIAEYPNGDPALYALLSSLTNESLYFDEIVSIEDIGEQETFDVCMPETHSFIASSVVNHNTEIACGLIQQILKDTPPDKRIVFFTHSKEIFAQSKLRIEERLGMKVGTIGNGKWDEHRVMVVMIPTLSRYLELPKKLPKSKRLTELTEHFELMKTAWKADKSFKDKKEKARLELKAYEEEQWEILKDKVSRVEEFLSNTVAFIADEAHHSSADTWYNLFMKMDNAYFRFGLTGTVDRSNPLNVMRLFASTGRIVKEVSNDYLISKGYSAKPTIYMLELRGVKPVFSRNYMEVRKEGIILCSLRNRIFAGKVQERANSGKQCLIIVNETEHGQIMLDLLRDKGFTVDFTHGDKSNKHREQVLQDLKSGQLRVLIATTILDEGVDVSGINCLFLMAGGKSMRQVLQRIGRGLRKKADGSGLEVYDSLDYHNEYLTEHTLDRYTTYKDEGFDIVKVSR